ncbi:6141_t:CDS:10 [Diversispora eburnea]|uniref:6141_t:CDS:1 n=1 Tax=Diversispora eburnea TaxID=1213867 RepID=A0A9N8VQE7_9GLOM|nr:6141_t:CDS:10 [Diversispora eburnea]
MPSVQVYQLVNDISIDLYEKYLPRFLLNDDDDKPKPQNKRRKLDTKIFYDNQKSPQIKKHIMEPLIVLIIRFLRSIKISPTFQEDMARISQILFDRFIYVVLTSSSMVYSALSLHYTLVELSYDYWKKLSVTEFSPIYNDILDNISIEDPTVVLYLNKVRLQHIHNMLKTMKSTNYNQFYWDQDTDNITKKLSDVIFTLLFPKNLKVTWSGKMIDLNEDNFPIANSMLIIGEWLNIICIGTVCIQALSSAEFFEIKPLRDNFLENFLQELGILFKSVYEDFEVKKSENAKKDALTISLISLNEEKRTPSELHNFIKKCFEPTANLKSIKKIPINDKYIQRISRLITLLHLFPMEYFEKREINILITLSLLIDRFIFQAHLQKYQETVNILKCSVICRNLVRKFMSAPIKQDDILPIHEEHKEITKHYEGVLQVTIQSTIIMSRYMLSKYRENPSLNLDYLRKIVKMFTGALDRSTTLINLKFEAIVSYKFIWKFVAEFMKLGYESFESHKNLSQRDHEILEPFLDLQVAAERFSENLLTNFLDNSLKKIQESDDIEIKRNCHNSLTNLDYTLKAYWISSKFYRLSNTLKSIDQASTLISLAPKFFALTIPLLQVSPTNVMNNGVKKNVLQLDENFGTLISQLSIEKYGGLSNIILEKLEQISIYKANNLNAKEKKFIIHFIDIFIRYSTHAQLLKLQVNLSDIIYGMICLADSVDNMFSALQILQIFSFLIANQALSFRPNEIGLILSAVITLTSSNVHFGIKIQDYKDLFEAVCQLLLKTLINRREILSSTIASFVIIIQSMLHCFKSRKFSTMNSELHNRRYNTIWDANYNNNIPLPVESATSFSRLLETISPFTKHVHNIIAEYLNVQIEGFIEPRIKESLKPGIYSLLDLCGDFERDMIMVSLDHVGKSLFKTLWVEYVKLNMPIPSVEEVNKWNQARVLEYLRSKRVESNLDIEDQKVAGSALLDSTLEELMQIGLKRGQAKDLEIGKEHYQWILELIYEMAKIYHSRSDRSIAFKEKELRVINLEDNSSNDGVLEYVIVTTATATARWYNRIKRAIKPK